MWKYGIGKSPEKKFKKDNSSKIEKDKIYDTNKRTRVFQHQWLEAYKWLEYDAQNCKMFCTVCKSSKLAEKSVFIDGSNNFKIDSIKAHHGSVPHLRAARSMEILKKAPGTSEASKALMMLHDKQKDRLIYLFRTVHALAKKARPFTDFVWHCQLDQMKNVDIGEAYRTDKACKEFTSYIAKACLQKLISEIDDARCFSLICDESTDTAIMEQLIIYIMYCNHGRQNVKFLNLCSLKNGTAEAIYVAIKDTCIKLLKLDENNPFDKLLCFVADGATPMQGVKKGVAQRLSKDQPNLIKIHCMAHRLELAFKDTLKHFSAFSNIQAFLYRIFKFYHNSATNRAQLKEASISLQIKELVPTRVGGTRWLPHLHRAFKNFFLLYNPILLQLQNCSITSKTESANIAKGLLKSMKSETFMQSAIELSEVVSYLEKVSRTLQYKDITLFHAYNTVCTVIDFLKDLKQDNEIIKRKLEKLNLTPDKKRKCVAKKDSSLTKFIDDIIKQLKIRFPDIDEEEEKEDEDDDDNDDEDDDDNDDDDNDSNDNNDKKCLRNITKILSLTEWPSTYSSGFGKEELETALVEYGTVLSNFSIETDNLMFEWASLLKSIYAVSVKPENLTWEKINSNFNIGHMHILALIDLLHSIPSTSVEAERGFRNLKDIKSDWRNQLNTETVVDLMRVYLDTPEIEYFDPIPAVSLWIESGEKSKKICTKPYSQLKLID